MAARKKKAKKITANASEEIKAMEKAKREEAVKSVVKPTPAISKQKEVKLTSFAEWYFARKGSIHRKHSKEIILADFKSRGLQDKELIEKFDEALGLYGVKL